jgi:hypothetical protein
LFPIIYSFRHADPNGIINFEQAYPQSVTHPLSDCFRCSPAVLNAASNLIVHNPQRVAKNITALYAAAEPPVNGKLMEAANLGVAERPRELRIKKAELRIVDETHFVACDESEPFVNRAAFVRSVKQQSVEVLIF